jgi:hypothetical protein
MRFITKADRKTIHANWWDDDEHVVIKRFSYGDRQRLADAAIRIGIAGPGQATINEVQVGQMNLVILELGIHSWTLKREDGKIAPLTRKMIEALREEDAEFILAEINALNRRRTAEEQSNFRGDGGDSSADGEPAAA